METHPFPSWTTQTLLTGEPLLFFFFSSYPISGQKIAALSSSLDGGTVCGLADLIRNVNSAFTRESLYGVEVEPTDHASS